MNVRSNLEVYVQDLEECAQNCELYAQTTRPEYYKAKAEAFRQAKRMIEDIMPVIVQVSEK